MTYRTKMILLSTLTALLLSGYLMGHFLTSSDTHRLSPNPWLRKVDRDDIKKIEFENPRFSLVRSNDVPSNDERNSESSRSDGQPADWNVVLEEERFPADNKKVEAFIGKLSNVGCYSEAALSSDSWARFSVDNQNGIELKIYTSPGDQNAEAPLSTPAETIVFGDTLQGSARQYARKISSEITYVVDDISSYLEHGTGYWTDLALFPEDLTIQDVISVKYRNEEDREHIFQRSEGNLNQIQWQFTSAESSSETVDVQTMNRHIRSLIELRGEKYATREERLNSGTTDPNILIRFETAEGRMYELQIGNKNSLKQVYVRPSHTQYTYLVSEWKINTALNPLHEMLPRQSN